MELKYFNRSKNQLETEKIYGEDMVRWLYASKSGNLVSQLLIKPPVSKLYGYLQSRGSSAKKVLPFIRDFNIQIDDFKICGTKEKPYNSFNQFFIREYKEGKRPFKQGPILPSFAEGRYFGYEKITNEQKIPVKGEFLEPSKIIANSKWNDTFKDGPLMIARLCPVDYHRYHFPDDGIVLDDYRVKGDLHSVNPIALMNKETVFIQNERHVTILETKEFGKLAYIEVGAICVGKIIQSYQGKEFKRGQEKGYFLFGGSTVVLIGEKGKWAPSTDMLKNTKEGIETYIQLGDEVGIKSE